jgi:hypothetical protein
MRAVLAGAVLLLTLGVHTEPAAAQDYPWCAHYMGSLSGATNCGFVSYEQCMMTARGAGAFCSPNPMYRPVAEPRRPHPRKPRRPRQ